MGGLSEWQTQRHISRWRRDPEMHVLYIRPDDRLAAAAGSGIDDLFDPRRAPQAEAEAYQLTARRISQFERDFPGVLASVATRNGGKK